MKNWKSYLGILVTWITSMFRAKRPLPMNVIVMPSGVKYKVMRDGSWRRLTMRGPNGSRMKKQKRFPEYAY